MIHLEISMQPPDIDAYTKKRRRPSHGQTEMTSFELELAKATAFFTDPANYADDVKLTSETFDFSVYKSRSVSDALVAAYGLKCAYCESDFAAVTPKEVEHYRPKAEIDRGNGASDLQPGYWWLAGVWSNLLISCVDCNRQRNHEVPHRQGPVKLGKGTLFPLLPAVPHARTDVDLVTEEPGRLLLHPVFDDPMAHITFDDQALVHPVEIAGRPDPKGEASIRAYALQRGELVKRRLPKLNDLKKKIEDLIRQVEMHNDFLVGTDGAPRSLEQIASLRRGLEEMFAPNAEYLGMLREHVRREKAGGRLAILEQFGIDLEQLL